MHWEGLIADPVVSDVEEDEGDESECADQRLLPDSENTA